MKVAFLGVLHNNEKVLIIHKRLVVFYYVGVLKRTDNCDFIVGCFHVIFLGIMRRVTLMELELIFLRAKVFPSEIRLIL